jgi:hypothetical protein
VGLRWVSLTGGHLDALLAAGATAEQIVALVKADLAEREAALEEKRTKDRERQRRHRESRNVTVCHSDNENVTEESVTPSPDKVPPHTPLQTNPNPSPPYNPPTSQKRGTRLADDFEPRDDWIDWAMRKRGWSRAEALDECECFIRYWQSKPGREAMKLDWPKTWQNWVVNSRREKAKPDDRNRITV